MPQPRRRSLLRRVAKPDAVKDREASAEPELPSYFVELPPAAKVPDAPNRPEEP